MTRRCNQRCFFCYEDIRDNEPEPRFEQIKALIDDVREHAQLVVLCGKEALLRRDISDVIGYASGLGLHVSAFTNGRVLARDGLVEAIADGGLRSLQVSFHFPDAETYAKGTRTSERGFERVIRGLEAIDEHNRQRPESSITVYTETDMFVMNSGKLVMMRDLLLDTLGSSLAGMRLGCLLPTATHDIGLPHVIEPLAARRQELETFIESHPSDLHLEFVKLPLCLISEQEHLAKGVSYLLEGTVLTYNHELLDRLSFDRSSTSIGRDLLDTLRRHPYRWICRSCPLVAMCRFERVDWKNRHFEPTTDHKPIPPAETEPREIFARVDSGDVQEAVEALDNVSKNLDGVRFPEEDLLTALEALDAPDEPKLVNAYVDREPILVVELETGSSRVALHIRPPSLTTSHVGAIVDIFDVRGINEHTVAKEEVATCLHALARVDIPPLQRWAEDEWFDPIVGRLFRSAWRCLGDRAWPGLGTFSDWDVVEAGICDGPELSFVLRHSSTNKLAELWFRDRAIVQRREAEPSPEIAVIVDDCNPGSIAHLQELLGSISSVVEGDIAPIDFEKSDLEGFAGMKIIFKLLSGRWCAECPVEVTGAAEIRLVLRVTTKTTEKVWLGISRFERGQAHWLRVGDYALSYGPGALTPDLERLARGIEVAMKTGRVFPVNAGSAPGWSSLAQKILEKIGLAGRYELEIEEEVRRSWPW